MPGAETSRRSLRRFRTSVASECPCQTGNQDRRGDGGRRVAASRGASSVLACTGPAGDAGCVPAGSLRSQSSFSRRRGRRSTVRGDGGTPDANCKAEPGRTNRGYAKTPLSVRYRWPKLRKVLADVQRPAPSATPLGRWSRGGGKPFPVPTGPPCLFWPLARKECLRMWACAGAQDTAFQPLSGLRLDAS